MSNDILASLLIRISADTAKFGEGLQRAQSQLSSFTSQIQKMAGAVGLSFGAFQAFQVVKSAVNSLMEFEKELSQVKAITGATDKEFQQLRKSALDLGNSTKFTAKEVAELQVEFGRLGFSTKEILAATGATLDLAVATGSDLAKAADVAGSTVRGFGLSADETRRVVDVMAESFNASALGLENFSEAMKYVAPVAAQAGLSVEETTALLGTLADAGIRGSQAGTSLRKIISDIGGESGTLAEKLQKLADKGLTGADAMSEVGRTAYASLLVLAKNTDKTRELTEELNYSAGAGKEAAKVMGDNLAGDVDKLSSAYDSLVLSAGGATSILREFVQGLTQIVSGLNSGNSALGNFTSGWLKLVTVIPRTVISGLGGISQMTSGVNDANKALKEQEEKTKIIEGHVSEAWKSGIEYLDVYMEALKGVPYEYEIIKAILEKFNKEQTKTNEEVLTPQIGIIAGIEEHLKTLEEAKKNAFSEGEIVRFNVEIDKLKEKLDLLNASRPLSNFGKQTEQNAQAGLTTNVEDPSGTSAPDMGALSQPLQVEDPLIKVREGITMTQDQWREYYATLSDLRAQEATEYEKNAQTAMQYGSVVGDAISSVISGQESAMGALKKVTGEILRMLFQRAMAGIISSATQTPGPPPVVLAAAAAGMAVIGGLFAKIGAPRGGSGGGSSIASAATAGSIRNTPDRDENRLAFDATFRMDGDEMVAVVNKVNNKNNRLNG